MVKETEYRTPLGVVLFLHPGLFQHYKAQPRADNKRYQQGDEHRCSSPDRNRTHIRPHKAGDERHGQESGYHGKCGEDRRVPDFIYRMHRNFSRYAFELKVPVYVLNNHDRVINENTYRENERKECDPVQGVSVHIVDEYGQRKGDGHRHTNDQRFPQTE